MYKISFVLNNDDECVGLQVSLIDFTMLKLCIYYLYIVQRWKLGVYIENKCCY